MKLDLNLKRIFLIAKASIKSNEQDSLLGIGWTLIWPVASVAILYFAFRSRFDIAESDYLLYLLVGVVLVNYFISCTSTLIPVLQYQRGIILNSLATVQEIQCAHFVAISYKLFIELLLCICVSLVRSSFTLFDLSLLFIFVALFLFFTFNLCYCLSITYCYLRDIRYLWTLGSRMLLFVTPIFYQLEELSELGRLIISYGNPLTSFVLVIRGTLILEEPIPAWAVVYSLILVIFSIFLTQLVNQVFSRRAMENV